MRSWFSVERVDSTTFAISEWGHWEETHSYLLNGKGGSLLIDTGMGVDNIREVACRYAAFEPQVVTTHAHWDHIGGHGLFADIAIYEAEVAWLDGGFPVPRQTVLDNLLRPPHRIPDTFRPTAYEVYQGAPTRVLRDGDALDIGGRTLQVLHTPGHSPGHICLYEPARQYLFTGDLLYQGTMYAFYPSTDPAAYHRSVDRVRRLPVRRVLPGHHALDVPDGFAGSVFDALDALRVRGLLRHGTGLHAYEGFSIEL